MKDGGRDVRKSASSGHDVAPETATIPARILLVDDDAALAFMLADVLESAVTR